MAGETPPKGAIPRQVTCSACLKEVGFAKTRVEIPGGPDSMVVGVK